MADDYAPEHRADDEPVVGDAPPSARVFLSNAAYDKLKFVAVVLLPALAVFYIAVAPLWGFPKQEEVAGTIMALDLLLGVLLGISTSQYKNSDARFDGAVLLEPTEEGNTNLRVQLDPEALRAKDEVTVKVVDLQ